MVLGDARGAVHRMAEFVAHGVRGPGVKAETLSANLLVFQISDLILAIHEWMQIGRDQMNLGLFKEKHKTICRS